jgi:hypothetical protein
MIVFDLECGHGHRFEGWFDDAEAFEVQLTGGMIVCPYCEDTDIRKVMSPVAVKKSAPSTLFQGPQSIDYRRLATEMLKFMKDNFEDVGTDFTAEALKMHYGVTEKKNIRGSATAEEEKTLKEEGVKFHKIMLPKIEEDKTN